MTDFTPLPAAYEDLEPREVWRHFAALNAIPRASGHEKAARDYVKKIADAAGATSHCDNAGNIVVYVAARGQNANIEYSKTPPASAKTTNSSSENASDESMQNAEFQSANSQNGITVAVQSHLDMVCEKRPDIAHDFVTDAIVPRRDGDRIFATGTTLGADNGLGAALSLALLTTPNLTHGALELLFTVEEETGLYGAKNLDATRLYSTMLVNLDSEDPDELTLGCAGGAGTTLHLPLRTQSAPANWRAYELVVSGLKGGHSGVQIHEKLASAIKILAQILAEIATINPAPQLASIEGGSAHNAIPRDASARFFAAPDTLSEIENRLRQRRENLQKQWRADEPDLSVRLREIEYSKSAAPHVLTPQTQTQLLAILNELPHGVLAMSEKFVGKVQTSSNLSNVATRADEIEISTSTRSFVADELQNWQEKIAEIGARFGASSEVRDGYPGWEPDADSLLLRTTREVYAQVFGKTPQVEVVHAGLECGVILAHKPAMQAISFGPLIRGAHTPEENVTISTVAPTWNLLTTLLSRLA